MLSAVVLSGGQSTRMGQDKGLALLGGIPLVTRVYFTLKEVAEEVIISAANGALETYSKALTEHITIIEDRKQGSGPIEGLVSAFEKARGDYVLVSPCDTPFLKADICRLIVSKAQGHDAAVPITHGQYEPLHGTYKRQSVLQAFRKTMESGLRRPIDAFTDELDIVRVSESLLREVDPELVSFWNLNSPADLKKAEERILMAGGA